MCYSVPRASRAASLCSALISCETTSALLWTHTCPASRDTCMQDPDTLQTGTHACRKMFYSNSGFVTTFSLNS